MRALLLGSAGGTEVPVDTLATLLGAGLATVPGAAAEALLLEGAASPMAVAWRARMGGDLFSDKVAALFQELHRHRDQARQALQQVRAPPSAACCVS